MGAVRTVGALVLAIALAATLVLWALAAEAPGLLNHALPVRLALETHLVSPRLGVVVARLTVNPAHLLVTARCGWDIGPTVRGGPRHLPPPYALRP